MIADALFRPIDAAKVAPRRLACVPGRQAAMSVLRRKQIQVRGDFVGEPFLIPTAGKHRRKTRKQRADAAHDLPSSIFDMIVTVRAQLSVSRASCFFPVLVIA